MDNRSIRLPCRVCINRQKLSGLGPLLSYTLEYAGVLTNVEEGAIGVVQESFEKGVRYKCGIFCTTRIRNQFNSVDKLRCCTSRASSVF